MCWTNQKQSVELAILRSATVDLCQVRGQTFTVAMQRVFSIIAVGACDNSLVYATYHRLSLLF